MGRLAALVTLVCLTLGGSPAVRRGEGDQEESGAGARRPDLLLDIAFALDPIRSAAFLSYRSEGLGEIHVTNRGPCAVEGLSLRVELPVRPDLLPEPFERALPRLNPGAVERVRILPRFAPAVTSLPTSELTVRAVVLHRGEMAAARDALVPVADRSSITWDLPERIAALIDPQAVAALVRSAAALGRREEELSGLGNFALAAAAFDALAALGLRYLEDSPSSTATAVLGLPVDRVNLPAETLRDRSGDCDDLAVLLASAFEALGVRGALGIFEDHVIVLFESGLAPAGAENSCIEPSEAIERDGRLWVPVEATELTRSGATLLGAWRSAQPRIEAVESREARFFEVRKAWSVFPAIATVADRRLEDPFRGGESADARTEKRSAPELVAFLRARVAERAQRARALADPASPGDGERREASAFAAAGLWKEAEALLRRAVALGGLPETRVELAAVLLSAPVDLADLPLVETDLERALRELDPMDLAARGEARKHLDRVQRLLREPFGSRSMVGGGQ